MLYNNENSKNIRLMKILEHKMKYISKKDDYDLAIYSLKLNKNNTKNIKVTCMITYCKFIFQTFLY